MHRAVKTDWFWLLATFAAAAFVVIMITARINNNVPMAVIMLNVAVSLLAFCGVKSLMKYEGLDTWRPSVKAAIWSVPLTTVGQLLLNTFNM